MAEKQSNEKTEQKQSTQTASKQSNGQGSGQQKRRNKNRKRPYRPRQCPYCYEKVDIERKGSILICYTCGNDS